MAVPATSAVDRTRPMADHSGDPGSGRSLSHFAGGFAPIVAVQTGGPVSPEQSFMGAAANGWDGWSTDGPLSGINVLSPDIGPTARVDPHQAFRKSASWEANSWGKY